MGKKVAKPGILTLIVKGPKNRERREISLKPVSTKNVENTCYLIVVTFLYFLINSPKFTLSNFLIPTIYIYTYTYIYIYIYIFLYIYIYDDDDEQG